MFLGLPDPHPDSIVVSTDPAPDPAPDPSIIKKIVKKPLFLLFSDFFVTFTSVADPHSDPDP